MRLPGWKATRQSARWLRSRFFGKALILGYHRIAAPPQDPFGICVRPSHFESQLEIIRRLATPIGLTDLVKGLLNRESPPRAVAITFDDGYRDNFSHARPLLERHDVPATIFATTGYLGGTFWWDELEILLLSPAFLPGTLELSVERRKYSWNGGNVGSDRYELLLSLYRWLLPLQAEQRDKLMAELRCWAKAPATSQRLLLTPEEVSRLANNRLFEIGAHSVTHPSLSGLAPEAQRREIIESKEHLERLLNREIHGFAFPNGAFDDGVRERVREAGFAYACESTSDCVGWGTDQWSLPRFWIRDWDGATFERWLARWLPR
jgi:peptidoglycan/xylan/chitin deacetylase (PgdA/CDA1 family)